MIITYFRSSSFNQWAMCQQSYFLTYVLGTPQPDNQKAEQGTIVHKVMEWLAVAKKAIQDKHELIKDEIIGDLHIKPEIIYTKGFVDFLFEKSYSYYIGKSKNVWLNKHKNECYSWVNIALNTCNGCFDPRKQNIISPELSFDFEIPEDWANYKFKSDNGEIIEGKLRLKGTIDLVVDAGNGIIESIDYKSGQRIDWGSDKEWPHNIKTYDKLMNDPQLRIYHYALSTLFPNAEQIIPTIYYIRDAGTKLKPVPRGAFSLPFTKNDIIKTKEIIRKRFDEIKKTTRPILNKTWRCSRLCHFGKTKHPSGTNNKYGEPHTICSYISEQTKLYGIDFVVNNHTNEGHNVGKYKAPGT